MPSPFPQIIFGYHGCDRSIGEAVLLGKEKLRPSTNPYDWLGSGLYFWENSYSRALQWAKEAKKNPKLVKGEVKDPFVLGALIVAGNCFNLMDAGCNEIIKNAYNAYFVSHKEDVLPANKGKLRNLDCFMVNHTITWAKEQFGQEFDTVRGTFIEGNPVYPESGFYEQTHIQICVRNTDCIVGYFRPEE